MNCPIVRAYNILTVYPPPEMCKTPPHTHLKKVGVLSMKLNCI